MKGLIVDKSTILIVLLLSATCSFATTIGTIPDSKYIYANAEEHQAVLSLPWVDKKVRNPNIEFSCPKCAEEQAIEKRFEDVRKYTGTIKLAAGTVVDGFSIMAIPRDNKEFDDEIKKLESADGKQVKSVEFIRSFTSISRRKDLVEMGIVKVDGKNSLWATTRMERRVGNKVVYRGLQRCYTIPTKDGKKVVMAAFLVGVNFVDEFPYADFKALIPVGEKFISSIKERKWKLW